MDIWELKRNIFYRAAVFIESMGHFAPFGARISGAEIIDVVYDSDEIDIVDGNLAVKIIMNTFSKQIDEGDTTAVAVGFDVLAHFNNADGISEKRDALCLKISTDGVNWSEEYFPDLLIEGKCIWQ